MPRRKKAGDIAHEDFDWSFWVDPDGYTVDKEIYQEVCDARDYMRHPPLTYRTLEKYMNCILGAVISGYITSIKQGVEIWAENGWRAPQPKWYIEYSSDPFHRSSEYKKLKGIH